MIRNLESLEENHTEETRFSPLLARPPAYTFPNTSHPHAHAKWEQSGNGWKHSICIYRRAKGNV
jgi:hypothetical protein